MFCMDLSLWDDNLRNVLICLCQGVVCSTLTEPSYLFFPFSLYAKLSSLAICSSFIIWYTESSTALFLISNSATKKQHNWFPTMTSVYTCLQGLSCDSFDPDILANLKRVQLTQGLINVWFWIVRSEWSGESGSFFTNSYPGVDQAWHTIEKRRQILWIRPLSCVLKMMRHVVGKCA